MIKIYSIEKFSTRQCINMCKLDLRSFFPCQAEAKLAFLFAGEVAPVPGRGAEGSGVGADGRRGAGGAGGAGPGGAGGGEQQLQQWFKYYKTMSFSSWFYDIGTIV